MLLATLILAQTIALDPQSGVWFPPAGRRDDYLERRRNFSQDVKEAFADPKLMMAVCTAVVASPKPGTEVDAHLRQMRMMLDMACAAAMTNERERPAREARVASIDATLAKQLDDATAFAATIPADKRKAAQGKLLEEIDAMTEAGLAHLTAIVRAIVLRPQDARGAWLLLRAGTETRMSSRELAETVERLYRARAAAIGREAPDWEAGLREVLLYLGKDDEARRLTESKNDSSSDYDRMLLAFLEEIHEGANAIDPALPKCNDAQFCRDVIWSLATRTARVRGALTPPAVAGIVERTIAWYLHDWPVRLETTRVLVSLDPVRGRKALTAMYATPEIPEGAVLDAIQIDASVSFAEKDHLRTIALRDCWLKLRGVEVPALGDDAWARLAALEEPKKQSDVDGCHSTEKTAEAILSDCTTRLLKQRLYDAMYIQDWALARQSVEKLVAYTLASGLAPTVARGALAELAGTMSREGNPEEAARVVRYLDRQPMSPAVRFTLDDFRKRLPTSQDVTLEPWDRPVGNPAVHLPPICGTD